MTVTVANSTSYFQPKVRYTAGDSYQTRNKIFELLSGGVAVTFGGEPKRTGTFNFMFDNEADAYTAYLILRDGYIMRMEDSDDVGMYPMYFVVSGAITREWEAETNTWTVSVDFQETST